MEGTRLRILQLLQRNKNDTVDGLARGIGLAPATIRRHLDILQRDNLVSFQEVRKKTGRPEYSFHLTEGGHEELPKHYPQLLSLVLAELSNLSPEDTNGKDGHKILESIFQRIADAVASEYECNLAGKDLSVRLSTLITQLRERGFSPETRIDNGTLKIRLLNCPFRSVALKNKAVCFFDLRLISSMLMTDVARSERIHDGDIGCTYSASLEATAEKELAFSASK